MADAALPRRRRSDQAEAERLNSIISALDDFKRTSVKAVRNNASDAVYQVRNAASQQAARVGSLGSTAKNNASDAVASAREAAAQQARRATDSVRETGNIWNQAINAETREERNAAKKMAAQRFVNAGANLGRGAAGGANAAGAIAASTARAVAAGVANETRRLGAATKKMAQAPGAVAGAVVGKIEAHAVGLFLLIALMIHIFDAANGFPRLSYGSDIITGINPASTIALAALFLAYASFKQLSKQSETSVLFKQAAAIIAITIVFYALNLFTLQDQIIHLYAIAIVAIWLLVFNGLNGGDTSELITLLVVGGVAYAFPLLGYFFPGMLTGVGKYFLNPLMHPWLFYYGIIKFQNESKFARRAAFLIIIGWLILVLSFATTNNQLVVGGETITRQHYLTAGETLVLVKDAAVKGVSNFVNVIVVGINTQLKTIIANAAGLEAYPGEKQGQQEGMRLKLSAFTSKKVDISYEGSVDVYATLEPIKRLEEPIKVTSAECTAEQGTKTTSKANPIKGTVNPQITTPIELFANEAFEFGCSFPNSVENKELSVGSFRTKISATYKFNTNSQLRTYFMDAERLRDELGRYDTLTAVASRHGIPTTKIIAKTGDSPVKIGIGGIPDVAPVGISTENHLTKVRFIGVSLQNDKAWKGKIASVSRVSLTVPEGFRLKVEDSSCDFTKEGGTYEVKTSLLQGVKDVDDLVSYTCNVEINDISGFLKNDPVAEKAFSVKADYEYKTTLDTSIEILKSLSTAATSTTTSSGGGGGSSGGTTSIGNGQPIGKTFSYGGGSDGPAVSCDYYPTDASIKIYEEMELYDRGTVKSGTSLKKTVEEAAKKHGIDPAFLAATAEHESAFNLPKYSCVNSGKSSLMGCGWPPKCAATCSCDNKWVWSDELQAECAAQTLRNGFNGEGVYQDCKGLSDDLRWACVFCHYQGDGGTNCGWNTDMRKFYCRWKAYYAKQEGVLT